MARINTKIEHGLVVLFNSINYRITQVISKDTVIARRFDNGISEKLNTKDIIVLDQNEVKQKELISIADSTWERANEKFNVIEPLLNLSRRTGKDVNKRAKEFGIHSATLYRWIKQYESTGKISALVPSPKTGGRGKTRLSDEVNDTLNKVIQDFYLTKDRPSIPKTIREVEMKCKELGLKPPGVNTIRARINKVSEKQHLTKRHGDKIARETHGAYPGKFADADVPLSVIQIDHTPLDLQVVDEIHRLAIGRPWVTVAIDVCSRTVTGFYISLEKPSALAVGLCISHSVLPKEARMAELNLNCRWPVMGLPALIHVDNAKEFDGHMLERACGEYKIDLHFRPLSKPNYGAHIERYLGTLNQQIHDLPGTTYSNPTQRSTYESEKNAVFTLREIEQWITTLICDVYHKEIHSEIKNTPEAQFIEGLKGGDESPGPGTGKLPRDANKFKLDFMPFIERTIQQNGVTINGISYFHDVLRTWINAKDPIRNRYKRKFIFRYDPRDISRIYFYDPELERYYEIPYRNLSAPRMTLWELRQVQKHLDEKGLKNYDEDAVFQAHLRLKAIEKEATKTTKKHRRNASRKTNAANASLKPKKSKSKSIDYPNFSDDEIEPFDDIEVNL